jgi:hypothetical protein
MRISLIEFKFPEAGGHRGASFDARRSAPLAQDEVKFSDAKKASSS